RATPRYAKQTPNTEPLNSCVLTPAVRQNTAATQKACDRYKARNTGNQQWDKCPDCKTSLRGDLLVCNSLGKHIGGDEWDYYCKQVGADMGKAS
ncbi:hypothetical protein CMUS01_15117, partial [Colletotrichum musicola]